MTAWQRTHVLRREEKGFGPVSLRRVLIAGFSGVLFMLFGGQALGFLGGLCGGLILLIVVLVITHPVAGRPFFKHAAALLRGMATVAAIRNEDGFLGNAPSVDPEAGCA